MNRVTLCRLLLPALLAVPLMASAAPLPSGDATRTPLPVGEVRWFQGHSGCVNAVAFCPDGRYAVTAGQDGMVRLWDVEAGKQMRRFRASKNWLVDPGPFAIAVSRDGKRIVSGHLELNTDVIVWETETGKEIIRLRPDHETMIFSVAISPDGGSVLAGDSQGVVWLWDVATGKVRHRFQTGSERAWPPVEQHVLGVAFSPDGRRFVSSGLYGEVVLWDLATTREVRRFVGHRRDVRGLAFSRDGKQILTGGGSLVSIGKTGVAVDDATVRLWDVESGEELRRLVGHREPIHAVAISSDGRRALSSAGCGIVTPVSDCTMRLWDLDTSREIHRFIGHRDEVNGVAFSPDGKYALSGSCDRSARLWRLPPSDAPLPPADGPVPGDEQKPWLICSLGNAWIAVPSAWGDVAVPSFPRMVLRREKDIDVFPKTDDTGARLQAGMVVEKYWLTTDSSSERMAKLVDEAKNAPGLELLGEDVEIIKLADGTEARLLTAEFVKNGNRRSLQLKMCVKDKAGTCWVVSGFLVGGKESKMATAKSPLARWLRACVVSFCFEKVKVDEVLLKQAHERLDAEGRR